VKKTLACFFVATGVLAVDNQRSTQNCFLGWKQPPFTNFGARNPKISLKTVS